MLGLPKKRRILRPSSKQGPLEKTGQKSTTLQLKNKKGLGNSGVASSRQGKGAAKAHVKGTGIRLKLLSYPCPPKAGT